MQNISYIQINYNSIIIINYNSNQLYFHKKKKKNNCENLKNLISESNDPQDIVKGEPELQKQN